MAYHYIVLPNYAVFSFDFYAKLLRLTNLFIVSQFNIN